jgi:L-gulonolactone oxidase
VARWSNWAGDQVCEPRRIVEVRTRAALAEAVASAVESGERVKVSASGHSFTDIALTDGAMIRMSGLCRILDADPSSGLVKVEAGANLHLLNRELDDLGLAFENLGDIDKQTVAGAISTGTHGTGSRFTNISAQLEAVELLTAAGEWLELSEESDSDAFRAARVGLGSLGAIASVTARCVPAYTIDRVDRPVPLAETLGGLEQIADAHGHFEFYVFPHTETALHRESRRTDEPPEPPNRAGEYVKEVLFENWALGALSNLTKLAPALVPRLARFASSTIGNTRKKDRSYRVFASQRRIRFTEMEYGIPREHATDAIERVLDLAADPDLKELMPI